MIFLCMEYVCVNLVLTFKYEFQLLSLSIKTNNFMPPYFSIGKIYYQLNIAIVRGSFLLNNIFYQNHPYKIFSKFQILYLQLKDIRF